MDSRHHGVGRTRRQGVALFIVAGLLLAGQALFAEGSGERSQSRTITVVGNGTATGKPDLAVVRLGVEAHNPNVQAAITTASAASRRILSSLEGNGVAPADIQTQQYSINFLRAPRGGQSSSDSATAGGSYQVTDVVAVTVRSLDRLGRILDGALSAGANAVQGITFELSDRSALEREARKAAFSDAREKALQLAKLSGVTLGPVLTIGESGGGGPVGVGGFRAEALAAPAVSPGSLHVTSTVHVVFAIARS